MYNHQILFMIAVSAAIIFVVLTIYLIVLNKAARLMKKAIKQETVNIKTVPHTTAQTSPENKTIAETQGSKEDFDPQVLAGQYTLIQELSGGAMGRVFVARKNNVGNNWLVKYIPKAQGQLSNEADILKELSHSALPQIVDVFTEDSGLYLVESYIQGIAMDNLLKHMAAQRENITETQILEWAGQLANVLTYLHTREHPILHLDLKPGNIMAEHSGNLVLIDFGISRRENDGNALNYATYNYAAPEQIKSLGNIEKRFGPLPPTYKNWALDQRTDLYSLGVILFEIATGQRPTPQNRQMLPRYVTGGICKIINKCLQLDPAHRYQTAQALLADINHQKTYGRRKIANALVKRKMATVAAGLLMPIAILTTFTAMAVREAEGNALLEISPEVITVSVQQSTELDVTRYLPQVGNPLARWLIGLGGGIGSSGLSWQATQGNIAQVDGNRLVGLNVGQTTLQGSYRGQSITMEVTVVEPMDGMVDISMIYRPGGYVTLFAGTTYRERVDGSLTTAEFVSPESMAVGENGAIYFTDAGWLRRISQGQITTVDIGPMYLRAEKVHSYQGNQYILTNTWQTDDGFFYTIMTQEGSRLYVGDAQFTRIHDFAVTAESIYIVQRIDGVWATYLRRISKANPQDIYTLAELPEGTSAMAMGENKIYLANDADGTIMVFYQGELLNLAGLPDQQHFIDGTAPLFFRPTAIKYHQNALYVWDFNTLRKIYLQNGAAVQTITIAGLASPTFERDVEAQAPAEAIIFSHSRMAEFAITDTGILLGDPMRGVMWEISPPERN